MQAEQATGSLKLFHKRELIQNASILNL